MSDHDRGAYTPPTDAPLSFDPRQPVRGSRPLPFTLIISVLVLLGVAAAIFVFYRSGVRQAGQPPQAVGAPVSAMKAPPPAEAQPQDPAAGLQIYKTEGGKAAPGPAAPTFTPGPEQPQARPQPAQPKVVTAPITPAALPPAAPSAAATPAQPTPTLRPSIPAQAPVAAAPAPAAKVETPAPKPVAAAPKAEKAPPPAAKPAPAKAEAKPEAKAAKPEAAKVAPAPAAGAKGGSVVQIGAVSSQALADKAWSDAAAVAPGLAAGKGKNVEKVDVNGKTLFRTQVTGFADRAAATAFCDKLKAAGKACFVK